jgi:hypothetical protein
MGMSQIDAKVMTFVEEALAANPSISTTQLYDAAKKKSRAISELSIRQFNARYPLQIKRRQSLESQPARTRGAARRGRPRRGKDEQRLQAVRKVLLRFAEDLSGAEARKDLVQVLANMDSYVTEVYRAASGR